MECISDPQRSLSPLARERQRSDISLCPRRPHFWLKQILSAKTMETLCWDHRDEFIYWTTYEIHLRKYEHYHDELKGFGNNAKEILLQIVATCTWAQEYHELTECTPDLYLWYMLWSRLSQFDEWEVPTMEDLTHFEYRAQCRERLKYLIVLLQF